MMLITLPFYMPIVKLLHFDFVQPEMVQIWFGVMMMIALEIGFTTPPFGMLLFVMKGVAPAETRMSTIMKAAMPFILLEVATLLLVMAVPWLATWLPGLISK